MRTITSAIFKYLAWALLILVALLYLDNVTDRVEMKAAIILCGIVVIDIIFGIAAAIRRASGSQRRAERLKEKKAREEEKKRERIAREQEREQERLQREEKRKATVESLKTSAGNTWVSIKEKSTDLGTTIKEKGTDLGTTIKEKSTDLGTTIKEKGSVITAAIADKIAAYESDDDTVPAIGDGENGRIKN